MNIVPVYLKTTETWQHLPITHLSRRGLKLEFQKWTKTQCMTQNQCGNIAANQSEKWLSHSKKPEFLTSTNQVGLKLCHTEWYASCIPRKPFLHKKLENSEIFRMSLSKRGEGHLSVLRVKALSPTAAARCRWYPFSNDCLRSKLEACLSS